MIADSSFLVALFLPEDELHMRAVQELSGIKENGFFKLVIPDRVLEETFTVLCYKKGVSYALEILTKLLHNKDILIYHLEEEEWLSIKKFIEEKNKKMSFTDYLVAFLALREHKKILCFDEQIIKLAEV